MSDDEWVARLRGRYAEGGQAGLEANPVFDDAEGDETRPAAAAPSSGVRCPACDAHPPLERLAGEYIYGEGLRHCPACYGFWATDAAVALGLAALATDHRAVLASEGPRRCRACAGHLKPDGACATCGMTRELLHCPACEREMERFSDGGATLDRCNACRTTWFDVGEVARVYGLTRPPSLAALADGGRAEDIAGDRGSGVWSMVLSLLAMFLRAR